MKTEAQVLAEMLGSTRELAKWYLPMLKDADVYKTFELEGKKFNPVIWEIGYLANYENFLGTYLTGGKSLKFHWAPLFGMGVTPPSKEIIQLIKIFGTHLRKFIKTQSTTFHR